MNFTGSSFSSSCKQSPAHSAFSLASSIASLSVPPTVSSRDTGNAEEDESASDSQVCVNTPSHHAVSCVVHTGSVVYGAHWREYRHGILRCGNCLLAFHARRS